MSVYEIKWLLPALKSLCEGKSLSRSSADLSVVVGTGGGADGGGGQMDQGTGAAALNSSGGTLPPSGINQSSGGSSGGNVGNSSSANTSTNSANSAISATSTNTATTTSTNTSSSTINHGLNSGPENIPNYFSSSNMFTTMTFGGRVCGGGGGMPLGSLQFDYNAVYMALKGSKYPETKLTGNVISSSSSNTTGGSSGGVGNTTTTATGPIVSPPLSSSSPTSSERAAERDYLKTEQLKRSRSDLSSIIIHQLTTPLEEMGKITWSPFSEELIDCSVL